jgi:prepilin-type N-terminal cleavage/methylation domain-containing protein/prepilin-type processing-associated H-X9-DG protein
VTAVSRPSLIRGCHWSRGGFTLIELLVVVAIIGLLNTILLPSIIGARHKAKESLCQSNLRVLGQGLYIYAVENRDVLPPGRLPKLDDCNAYAVVYDRVKYRPTFLAMMSKSVGARPFDDPMPCKSAVDRHGEAGDQQDYSYKVYVCPSVPEWTDERNGSYGYNYQFLGNSRLLNAGEPQSYKNWPVQLGLIRFPGKTVAVADCMGTAASWPTADRQPYLNNARDADRLGNEGFNLDPPRVDPSNGEMANFDSAPQSRSAAAPRHRGSATVLWVDGHAGGETLSRLGYRMELNGRVLLEGDNTQWTGNARNQPWMPDWGR